MRLVDKPVMAPHRCAALPFVGQSSGHSFIDTGSDITGFDQRVYVSKPAVETMAVLIGWYGPVERAELAERAAAAEARAEALEVELERLQTIVDAVDTMESADFRARRKPGRPKKIEMQEA